MNRTAIAIFSVGFVSSGLVIATGIGGCQSNSNTTPVDNNEPSTTTTGATMSTSGGTGSSGSTSTGTGSGGGATCAGQAATIADITGKTIGPKEKVALTGVVAMSQKFLVSKSSSGSCLWGLYISAPGLSETAAGSGLLALSYGTDASIAAGGTKAYCPELGTDVIGDKLPDAVKPGDVLDLVGESAYFILAQCATQPAGATSVAQFQLSNVCSATITGSGAVPKAHVLSAAEELELASPTDQKFHDDWGGVKVQISNVTAVDLSAVDGGTGSGGGGGSGGSGGGSGGGGGAVVDAGPAPANVVNQYGDITLDTAGGGLIIPDDIYYQGYAKTNVCHAGPTFTSDTFTSIAGFNAINFCTWSFYVDNKCTDFVPASVGCSAATMCP